MLKRILVLVAVFGMTQGVHAAWKDIEKFQDGMKIRSRAVLLNTRAEIYERTAIALSKMEVPDFSDFSENDIQDAFWVVFIPGGSSADKIWLKELQDRVAELSGGTVRMHRSSAKHFQQSVRGAAEYLILKKGKTKMKVVLGPYSTPITFSK